MGQPGGIAPSRRPIWFNGELDRDFDVRSPGPIVSLVQARSSWSHRLRRYFFLAAFAEAAAGFGAGCDGACVSTLRCNTVNEARACAPATLSGLTTTALVFAMSNCTTTRIALSPVSVAVEATEAELESARTGEP